MLVRNSEYKPDSLIDRDRTEVAGIAQRGKRIVYGFLAVFAVWGTFVPLQSSITAR